METGIGFEIIWAFCLRLVQWLLDKYPSRCRRTRKISNCS